jgi:flagellar assembly factor FliW
MPKIISRNFGAVEFSPGEQFVFPNGLPGFPCETDFLPVEVPDQLPLVYLQSLRTSDLCFVAAPVNCVVEDYQLCADAEDLTLIDLGPDNARGPQTLCLALLCFAEDGRATANLRAPLIVNLRNRRGVQAIRNDDRYAFRFPLQAAGGGSACS